MLGEQRFRAGMDRPTEIEGWWLAVLWVADADGIVACRVAAPPAGPPADPPLLRLGPLFCGDLAGFVLEEDGRQQIRLRLPVPADDPEDPWSAPLVIQAAIRWEPARAAAMTQNALADVALTAFRRAVEGSHRP